MGVPISSSPAAGQIVEHDGKRYTTIQEGLAYILVPEATDGAKNTKVSNDQSVFYNPIQQFNRDLTVLAIKAFGEDWIASRKKNPSQWRQKKIKKKENRGAKRTLDTAIQNEVADKRRKVENTIKDDFDDCLDDGGIPDELLMEVEKDFMSSATVPKSYKPPFRILDALSATGLRALRYAKEIPFATHVTANDLSEDAAAAIKVNAEHNNLPDSVKMTVNVGNAVSYLNSQIGTGHSNNPRYSVIDLDPYGTAVPFIDSAVRAIANDGLLCVTCTDSALFNSMGYLEKTFYQYGGLPIKGDAYGEVGLRLILNTIATTAAKYGISMEPLLSLSIDYYARVFVRLRSSPSDVKRQTSKTMISYICEYGCGSWNNQFFIRENAYFNKNNQVQHKFHPAKGPTGNSNCQHCGYVTHMAGPMWGGPLHNPSFVEKMLKMIPQQDEKVYATKDRIHGVLTTALEETHMYDYSEHFSPTTEIPSSYKKEMKGSNVKVVSKANLESKTESNSEAVPETFTRLPLHVTDPHPFYFEVPSLSRILRCSAPSSAQFKGALRHMGYRVVRSHAKPGSIKTDAPWHVIWSIMRAWVDKSPEKPKSLTTTTSGWTILYGSDKTPKDTNSDEDQNWEQIGIETDMVNVKVEYEEGVGWKILKKKVSSAPKKVQNNGTTHNDVGSKSEKMIEDKSSIKREIVFDEKLGREEMYGKVVRYRINPPNWGPMSKAKPSK